MTTTAKDKTRDYESMLRIAAAYLDLSEGRYEREYAVAIRSKLPPLPTVEEGITEILKILMARFDDTLDEVLNLEHRRAQHREDAQVETL